MFNTEKYIQYSTVLHVLTGFSIILSTQFISILEIGLFVLGLNQGFFNVPGSHICMMKSHVADLF